MRWKPRVVVASIIERHGKYLMVEEEIDGIQVISQPSGHVEANEEIIQAIQRETLEETAWRFKPSALVSIAHLLNPDTNRIFIRFTFAGDLIEKVQGYEIDPDIHATKWMTYEEIKFKQQPHWRNALVTQSLDAYRAGYRYPLAIINTLQADNSCLDLNQDYAAKNASLWASRAG